MDKELGEIIARKFDELLHGCSERLLFEQEKVKIAAPKYIIDRLKEYYNATVSHSIRPNDTVNFRGIPVIIGYENKLVIFHEYAALYESKDMKHEINL